MNEMASCRIALVGGRGYTGAELLALLAGHPQMELVFASSSSQAGTPLVDVCPTWPDTESAFIALHADEVASQNADAWVLAVPNGIAATWAAAIREAHPDAVILDLSADHRFDDSWTYGLPERFRDKIRASRPHRQSGLLCNRYAIGVAAGSQLADRDTSGIWRIRFQRRRSNSF